MAEQSQSNKDAAKELRPRKPPEYRRFEEVLKKVIKAPPLRDHPFRKSRQKP